MLKGFTDRSDICKEFNIESFDGAVVYAENEQEGYEGSAAVVYAHGGKLFMVTGSHCSCYGFEGMWEPDEVTIEMLQKMAASPYKSTDQRAAEYVIEHLSQFHEPSVDALVAKIALT